MIQFLDIELSIEYLLLLKLDRYIKSEFIIEYT